MTPLQSPLRNPAFATGVGALGVADPPEEPQPTSTAGITPSRAQDIKNDFGTAMLTSPTARWL
ncbi:MAG: hypothetical protein NVSMB60_12860 [Mycobacterium sp.]